MMGFLIIGQLNIENVFQATKQLGIANWKNDLDAMTQVASHEVSAAEINFLVAPVPEIVDPTMLQKTAHDTGNADIVAESANQRPQAAESSYQQVNLHSLLRRPKQQPDHLRIFQCVHFEDQMATFALLLKRNFPEDHFFEALS